MNFRRLNFENALFILALLLGLGLRLYNLGAAPLNDTEANWALQALSVARPDTIEPGLSPGQGTGFDPQPAYIFLTGATFTLFGSSNFLARLWPALAGWSLVWLPLLLHRSLGRKAALLLAFGLALDPGLVITSRLAGGPAMSYGFGLLALGLIFAEVPVGAGIFAGLALLSGPAVIQGSLGLLLTAAAAWIIGRFSGGKSENEPADPEETGLNLTVFLITTGITIFIVGTLFFRFPQGLSAWFSTLPAYFSGWLRPSGIPAQQLLIALLVYSPLALLTVLVSQFSWLIRTGRGTIQAPFRHDLTMIWAIMGLGLALLYPARQTTDLAWVIIPLWMIASVELSNFIPEERPHTLVLILTGLIFIFATLFLTTLLATARTAPMAEVTWLGVRLAILGGILALAALTTALVALGWSWEIGRLGSVWGVTLVLLVHSTSALWGATQLRPNAPQELWVAPPGIGQANLFTDTLADISRWHTGMEDHIEIVSTVQAPSLRWVLRDYKKVSYPDQLPIGQMPSVVITPLTDEAPTLAAAYRGQDFVWWKHPGWTGVIPQEETVKWFVNRQAPLNNEYIILWVRADIFPGGSIELNAPADNSGQPIEDPIDSQID